MIFRITQKLAKKIHEAPTEVLPAAPNPFADWTAHVFRAGRVQHIIVTHTVSLYSIVTYGRGIADHSDFVKNMFGALRESLTHDGFGAVYETFVAPESGVVSFSKTGDRRLTGSVNELAYLAQVHLIEQDMAPFDVGFLLNRTPMKMLGYDRPRKAFEKLAQEPPS